MRQKLFFVKLFTSISFTLLMKFLCHWKSYHISLTCQCNCLQLFFPYSIKYNELTIYRVLIITFSDCQNVLRICITGTNSSCIRGIASVNSSFIHCNIPNRQVRICTRIFYNIFLTVCSFSYSFYTANFRLECPVPIKSSWCSSNITLNLKTIIFNKCCILIWFDRCNRCTLNI